MEKGEKTKTTNPPKDTLKGCLVYPCEESAPLTASHDENLTEVAPIVKNQHKLKKTDKLAPEMNEDEKKRKLDEAEQSVAKQGSRKKKIWNIIFFIINIAVVAGILLYQLLGKEYVEVKNLEINWWAVLVLILLYAGVLLSEIVGISYLMRSSTGKWRFGLSSKTLILGRYYDSVTPLATGGQAFQVTYLKGHDVSLDSALSIPLAKYTFSQIVWVLFSLICMIISFTNTNFTPVTAVAIVGFVLGSFMLFITIFLSVCKTVGRKLVVKSLKFLQRIKIVKNYERQYERILKYIEDFQSTMQKYIKSPKDFLMLFGSQCLKLIFQYSMPYFVAAVFLGFNGELYFKFFVMGILIDLAASFFPLPGGTGMSEFTYNALFEPYFTGTGALFWALLLWRFLSYYVYLLQGVILLTYDFVYGNRKYRWQKKCAFLMEESKVFKQEQINRFRAERNKRRARKI